MVEPGKQFRRVNGHLHLASLWAALAREVAETVGATCHDDLVFIGLIVLELGEARPGSQT